MNSETTIEATALGKVYWDGSRSLEVLNNFSLTARRGEGVAILGPSGSGKTTLLNLLSGLDTPSAGDVKIDGVSLRSLSENEKAVLRNKKIGFVFQFYHLLSELTALENVMLPAQIGRGRGLTAEICLRAENLLQRVGLKERMTHFPSELSGGEQQRVAIARALMNDPNILFCDEPTGNLDRAMGSEVAELLKNLFSKDQKTVVMVTHDEKIAGMADRVFNLMGETNGS